MLLVVASAALICLECNRPGLVLPGSLGLLTLLIVIASILHTPDATRILLCLALYIVLFLIDLRRPHILLVAAYTIALLLGLRFLAQSSAGTGESWASLLAIFLALLLAGGTFALNRIARRARTNKGLD